MELSKLSNWLPIYPEFDDDVRMILGEMVNTQQPSYDIYRKKEFNDFKLSKEENPPQFPERLFKHQIIISRFLSTHTPYKGLLLMHEPGTGKTCSSIAVAEQIKKEKSSIKGALILVKNDGLISNYKADLTKCSDDYEMEKGRISKNVYEFYEFQTFEKFISNDIIPALEQKDFPKPNRFTRFIQKYDNKVIIIDEIHNLRNTGKKSLYNSIFNFLHSLTNCKIILMSGTPMTDKPEEIADIMNLILPLERQLPIKKQFIKEFLTKIESSEKKEEDDDEEQDEDDDDEDEDEDDEDDEDEEEQGDEEEEDEEEED